ncbi:MAG: hypothetical protein B6242_02850 [Anaerolineaceae bacterium 4572_78]|nr:MAG: hypothetical protein B6242_02850 [Anaerolineaceae bacterium 4572_78]
MRMLQRTSQKLISFMIITDILLTLFALESAKVLRTTLPYGVIDVSIVIVDFHWMFYVIVVFIWTAVFLISPVYDVKRTYRAVDDLQITTIAILFSTLLLAGMAYFFYRELSRVMFLYFFILNVTFLLGFRLLMRAIFRLSVGGWPSEKNRILILGAGHVGRQLASQLRDYSWYGIEIVGFLDDDIDDVGVVSLPHMTPYLGKLNLTVHMVKQLKVDEVILALPLDAHEKLVAIIRQLQHLSINVRVVPDLVELAFIKTTVENLNGIPLLTLRDPVLDPFQQVIKRGFDIIMGGLILCVASPIMALISMLIKIDSPGSVLFRQKRVGENGQLFEMLKFRSMVQDADKRQNEVIRYNENGDIIHKSANDPRITQIGKIIRRTSLDELPQLINVIKGDMSLVGPRPEMPWLVELYEPWQRKRFAVPQGITGWWQINGRSDKPMHLHVEEDLYYVRNYSLLLDIIILWKTFGAVVKRSGAF